jgi:hypothetical protein
MIHRCSCRDVTDCSAPPTPGLVAGFQSRVVPPAPFPTTLAARSPPDSVECFIHSRPWGSVSPLPAAAGGGCPGSRFPGCRLGPRPVRPRRRPAEAGRRRPRPCRGPWPPPLQPPRRLVRLRSPDRSRPQRPRPSYRSSSRVAASPPVQARRPVRSGSSMEQAPPTRCVRSRPGWLLGSGVRPPVRVLPRPGCRAHRGRGRRAAPPRGGGPSAPLRQRPRRLSTTRPLTSSGFDWSGLRRDPRTASAPGCCPSRPLRPSPAVSPPWCPSGPSGLAGDQLPAPRTVLLL